LFVVNQKLPYLTCTFTSENPWLIDIADRNTKAFPIGINRETARQKGIAEGDPIVLETTFGRRYPGVARLSEGIHPECLAVPHIMGRWITSLDKGRGKGIHFNSLLDYTFDRIDTLSAALDACARVKILKQEGTVHA
jgi:anaerobic selenocysteine-containing dehydrogenase